MGKPLLTVSRVQLLPFVDFKHIFGMDAPFRLEHEQNQPAAIAAQKGTSAIFKRDADVFFMPLHQNNPGKSAG